MTQGLSNLEGMNLVLLVVVVGIGSWWATVAHLSMDLWWEINTVLTVGIESAYWTKQIALATEMIFTGKTFSLGLVVSENVGYSILFANHDHS